MFAPFTKNPKDEAEAFEHSRFAYSYQGRGSSQNFWRAVSVRTKLTPDNDVAARVTAKQPRGR